MPRFVVTAEFPDDQLARLRRHGVVRYVGWGPERRVLVGDEWHRILADADVALVEFERIGEDELAHAPDLRLVGIARGTQMVADLAALSRRQIAVLTTPGRNAESVADLTLAFAVMLVRQVLPAIDQVRRHEWSDVLTAYVSFRGRELGSLVLGLVGYGAVGRLVAHRAHAFGMAVLVYDPYASAELAGGIVEQVSLPELLHRSDLVSVHAAVTEETKGMIAAAEFAQMKPGAMFINTARSSIVETTALVEALRASRLAGAALDVFDEEPLAADSPIRDLPNVILTPHIGGATEEVAVRHSMMLADGVEAWLAGETPQWCLNPEVLGQPSA
jgi:phosphoglycerate dehydrogenase-like enzyme